MYISKKHFRLGGMAASKWTRSIRAIRDTPLADYSAWHQYYALHCISPSERSFAVSFNFINPVF